MEQFLNEFYVEPGKISAELSQKSDSSIENYL